MGSIWTGVACSAVVWWTQVCPLAGRQAEGVPIRRPPAKRTQALKKPSLNPSVPIANRG